jgi:cation:H+ antiporter
MLVQVLLLTAGIVVLFFSGSLVVSGASFMARCLGIRKMVMGVTVVAFGTSAPEFVVSLVAVLMGKKDISLGNVVGSNIANVGLALAVAALAAPIAVSRRNLVVEYPAMIVLSLAVFGAALTGGTIGRIEGAILVMSLIAFIAYAGALSREDRDQRSCPEEDVPDKSKLPRTVILVFLGLAGLSAGAKLLVDSSVQILSVFGIPEFMIGATVVAIGTSLPEMATTVIGAWKGESEIAVGNIIGSNVFNIGMVAGTVSLIAPLPVAHDTLEYEFPVMLFFAFLMLPMLLQGKGVGRLWGMIAGAAYAAFMVLAFSRAG